MPRATPLPPDERRALLVAATAPLLARHGRDVSTRQIAEAAGVAEGTIFRVFPTKEALIDATVDDAFDVSHTLAALAAVPTDGDLEERLVAAVAVLQTRTRQVFALFHTLHLAQHGPHDRTAYRDRARADNARVTAALADVVRPDADRLRRTPAEAGDLLRTVTFALSHPMLTESPAAPETIVDVVLHGVCTPSSVTPASSKEHAPC